MPKHIIFFVLLLSILPTIFAFGISSDYLENNILELTPEAHYEYQINLQNGAPIDLYVNLTVTNAEGIASLNRTSTIFYLPPKTYDLIVPLYITIPPYAFEGKTYDVSYSLRPVDGKSEGVSFTVVLSRGFTVKISKEGFIARDVRAPKPKKYQDTLSELTARVVMNIEAYKFHAGGALIVLTSMLFVIILTWKRSEIFSRSISKEPPQQKQMLSYTTLKELYTAASRVDETALIQYIQTYNKQLYQWLVPLTGEPRARALITSKTQGEFLQQLTNALH